MKFTANIPADMVSESKLADQTEDSSLHMIKKTSNECVHEDLDSKGSSYKACKDKDDSSEASSGKACKDKDDSSEASSGKACKDKEDSSEASSGKTCKDKGGESVHSEESSDNECAEETPIDCNKKTTPATALQSNTVLVVHASVGSGHRSAANAVSEALHLLRDEKTPGVPKDLEVKTLDILDWGRHRFDGDRAASMFVGATRPFYDLTWRYTFTGHLLWGGGTIWSHLMFAPFTDYIRTVRPLAVIATHITAANAAVAARMITGQDFPIVSVPTDYETEGLWPHKATDLFCVATESMAETLRARKIEDERIQLTGIPTREDFRRTYDKHATRSTFNLPHDKYVVLALAGAYLPRPYQHFRDALDTLLPYFYTLHNLHFVIVTGKDKNYYRYLNEMCAELELTNVSVLGYVEGMAALMAASDLIICKSGGLTVTECLCAQSPMVLLGRAYGQEKINMEMLTSTGCALHVTTPRELLSVLRQIMNNPEAIRSMLISGSFVRRPDAARDIAQAALRLAQMKTDPQSEQRKKHFMRFYWGHKPAHVR